MQGVEGERYVPDMVESCELHGLEVCFGDPGVPVCREDVQGDVGVLHLPERVLVDDGIVVGVLEDARCDPRLRICELSFKGPSERAHLQDKPTASDCEKKSAESPD